MNPEYITTTAAARLLGVTPQTIRNWIRSGKITTEPTLGGHNRIPIDQPVISDAIENYVPRRSVAAAIPTMVPADEL
jgi:excisionase family DNA binding protein